MKNAQKVKLHQAVLREKRTRARIVGKSVAPRMTVFRSLKHFYIQIIDDIKGITLCAAHDRELKDAKGKKPVEVAAAVGALIAEKAKTKNICKVVFDRGRCQYHGRIKAAADGARKGGLKF